MLEVSFGHNEVGEVQNAAVGLDLIGESVKPVSSTLDFVPRQRPIHECNVDPRISAKPQLVNHKSRVGLAQVLL